MKILLLLLIRLYQKTLSPDHSRLRHLHPAGFCRFSPSCSQYAHDAINEKGIWLGTWLAIRRLLKCNPWHKGGIDPLI